ncbi:MAG: hypothetical protein Q8O43_04335 [Dehalococcoidia bacterium]|nr:hypothetical protein [Dehalococcoidia bacterium]
MPKSDTKSQKPEPMVTVRIEPGKVSPAMREQWRRAWARLLQRAQEEQR